MADLDHDIREAERLGYGPHYGKYKADYPNGSDAVQIPEPVGTPARNDRRLGAAACAECGGMFYPSRKGNIFCSKNCQQRRRCRNRYRRKVGIECDG